MIDSTQHNILHEKRQTQLIVNNVTLQQLT